MNDTYHTGHWKLSTVLVKVFQYGGLLFFRIILCNCPFHSPSDHDFRRAKGLQNELQHFKEGDGDFNLTNLVYFILISILVRRKWGINFWSTLILFTNLLICTIVLYRFTKTSYRNLHMKEFWGEEEKQSTKYAIFKNIKSVAHSSQRSHTCPADGSTTR